MGATLEDVPNRLAALEGEVARLRQQLEERHIEDTAAERGAQLLRLATANQAALSTGWKKAMEEMGITGEPISAEELQEIMRARGMNPNDNAFSRGITEMRAE